MQFQALLSASWRSMLRPACSLPSVLHADSTGPHWSAGLAATRRITACPASPWLWPKSSRPRQAAPAAALLLLLGVLPCAPAAIAAACCSQWRTIPVTARGFLFSRKQAHSILGPPAPHRLSRPPAVQCQQVPAGRPGGRRGAGAGCGLGGSTAGDWPEPGSTPGPGTAARLPGSPHPHRTGKQCQKQCQEVGCLPASGLPGCWQVAQPVW